MSLRLSNAEMAAFERAISALLAPFNYDDAESWRRAAAAAVAECVGAPASSFEMLLPGMSLIAAEPDVARALQAVNPPPDWVVEALTTRRRQLGLTVTDWQELFDVKQVKRTYFYNEIVRPQGLLAPLTMLKGIRESPIPAALSLYFDDERTAQRHVARRKELLRLLFPAYCAGLRTFLAFRENADALKSLLEDVAIGVINFDARGRLLSENEFFQRLMQGDPERDRVRNEILRSVQGFASVSGRIGFSTAGSRSPPRFETAAGSYRIVTTLFKQAYAPERLNIVALVDRVDSQRMDGPRIIARYSLTHRQLDCALLLSDGLSSREIAARLSISVNTARRHLEGVFLKLDVHNRAAAVAKLAATTRR